MTPEPLARYLELADLVDGLVRTFAGTDDDRDDGLVLAELADAAQKLAELAPDVHTHDADAELVDVDSDNDRFAQLLADVAVARANGTARVGGHVPELEANAYVRSVLDQMAGQDEQPGWVLARRLNVLVAYGTAAGLATELVERLALAASHRPDGENEQADAELAAV